MSMRALQIAETKSKEAWPIQVACIETLKQPSCLGLSHLASGNSLIDQCGQLRIPCGLDRLFHRLQIDILLGCNGR